eukprot:SAG11_NODE_4727_length_1791_cov_1.012411_2_plen_232_part_00
MGKAAPSKQLAHGVCLLGSVKRRKRGEVGSLLDAINPKSAKGALMLTISQLGQLMPRTVRLYIDDHCIERLLVERAVNTWTAGDMAGFRTKMTELTSDVCTSTLGPLNVYAANYGGAGARKTAGKGKFRKNLWVLGREANPRTYSFTSKSQDAFRSFLIEHTAFVVSYHAVKSWAKSNRDGVCSMPKWEEFLLECVEKFPEIFEPALDDEPGFDTGSAHTSPSPHVARHAT